MNQPNDEQPKSVEERLYDLEQLFGEIIRNETELIKLSKRHTFNVQEVNGRVGSLGLDIGDLRERFDTVERKIDKIEANQGEHTKRFDRLEAIMLQMLDRLPQPEGE
ncbi:MAG TPA: hypothetical protein VN207_10930 [Ktedonobacteraceae bacterium]|nr:hypothetical protein [Ktedonobacteraceae bacterium]